MYEQFGKVFKKEVYVKYQDLIDNLIIGAGPNGQLKYTNERVSYSDYCTPGDFQIFDSHAQESFK